MKKNYLHITLLLIAVFAFSHRDAYSQHSGEKLVFPDSLEMLNADLAECIFEAHDGAIWLGFSNSGLYRFNGYRYQKILAEHFNLRPDAFDRVIHMHQSKDNSLFICARDKGVSKVDFSTKTASVLGDPERPEIKEALRRVWDIAEYQDGKFWMASWRGLLSYDSKTNEFELFRFPFQSQRNDAVDPNVFRCINYDPNQGKLVWISGISGLFTFDPDKQTFNHIRHPASLYEDGHRDFPEEHCQYLITDMLFRDSLIFLASWGGGLMTYNRENGTWNKHIFRDYKTDRTLDENIVNQLIYVADVLYFSTTSGLMLFTMEQGRIENLDANSENQLRNAYDFAFDRNNNLWVSSYSQGVFRFKIALPLLINTHSKVLEFSSISLDQSINTNLCKDTLPKNIQISPETEKIKVEFALVTPFDTSQVEYQYSIKTYTKGWISNGTKNTLEINDLKAGNYHLQLRAREPGDLWTLSPEILMQRKVFFYKSTWFLILATFILIALVVLILRLKIKRTLQKEKTEREMVELKMQALQAQMNPHFIFNSLNSINNYILKEDTEKASDHLNIFSRLVREVLKNSDQRLIKLQDDISMLEKYISIEQERFSGKFSWNIQIDAKIDPNDCFVPPLIIQPYVENAIWHGLMQKEDPGTITINYTYTKDSLEIEIVDNGIGREQAKQQKSGDNKKNGKGQAIAGSRIEMLNKLFGSVHSVEILDAYPQNPDKGTRVLLRIPYITRKNFKAFMD